MLSLFLVLSHQPALTNFLHFEAAYKDFTAKGVEQILCVSVNDAFVMNCLGQVTQVSKKSSLFPDGNGTFTNGVKALVDKGNLGMGSRAPGVLHLILDEHGNVRVVRCGRRQA